MLIWHVCWNYIWKANKQLRYVKNGQGENHMQIIFSPLCLNPPQYSGSRYSHFHLGVHIILVREACEISDINGLTFCNTKWLNICSILVLVVNTPKLKPEDEKKDDRADGPNDPNYYPLCAKTNPFPKIWNQYADVKNSYKTRKS